MSFKKGFSPRIVRKLQSQILWDNCDSRFFRQPFGTVAARTSRLDSDEEITIWQPSGERNSNWCKVPTVGFLNRPLWRGWRQLRRCDHTHAFAAWCWDLRCEMARRRTSRTRTQWVREKTRQGLKNKAIKNNRGSGVLGCVCAIFNSDRGVSVEVWAYFGSSVKLSLWQG